MVSAASTASLTPRGAVARTGPSGFAIRLTRLARAGEPPGLIAVAVASGPEGKRSVRLGSLTDAALRGRLAHFDAHSANEIAALRRALAAEGGQFVLNERWPARDGCLRFWYGFIGSKMRAVEWVCEKCASPCRENAGGAAGESLVLLCACGQSATFPVGR